MPPVTSRGRAEGGPGQERVKAKAEARDGCADLGALCWGRTGEARLSAPTVGSPIPGFWAHSRWATPRIPQGTGFLPWRIGP